MNEYITKDQASEFSCTGCAFRKIAEKGSHKGNDMCSAPDIEPFRSCMKKDNEFIQLSPEERKKVEKKREKNRKKALRRRQKINAANNGI